MFELLEEKSAKSGLRSRVKATFWIGFAVVAILIGLLVLVQSLWPSTMKQVVALARGPLTAPSVPVGKPPEQPATPPPPSRRNTPTNVFTAPPRVPPTVNTEPEPPGKAEPPQLACANCVPGAPNGDSGPSGPPLWAPPAPPSAPAPLPPVVREQPKPAPPQQVRVGGRVQEANLIRKVTPVYPQIAKVARVQGLVLFMAVIGRDGSIQNLQLVSGNPLLVPAAREAVAQWRYKPTLLNGDPVEVITEITVNFMLSQ